MYFKGIGYDSSFQLFECIVRQVEHLTTSTFAIVLKEVIDVNECRSFCHLFFIVKSPFFECCHPFEEWLLRSLLRWQGRFLRHLLVMAVLLGASDTGASH